MKKADLTATTKKMAEVTSTTWSKLAEIECDTSNLTIDKIRAIIEDAFGETWYTENFEEDEIAEVIEKAIIESYYEICSDGIIVWES